MSLSTRPAAEDHRDCDAWVAASTELIATEIKPDLVLTSGGKRNAVEVIDLATPIDPDVEYTNDTEPTAEVLQQGYEKVWSFFSENEIPVIAISDTPRPPGPAYECVLENVDDYDQACSFPRKEAPANTVLSAAAGSVPTAEFLDLDSRICAPETCHPVVGDVVVYRQSNHITASYSYTMRSVLEAEVDDLAKKLGVSLP